MQRLRNADQRQQLARLQRHLDAKDQEQKQTKADWLKLQVLRERDAALFKQQQANYTKVSQKLDKTQGELRTQQRYLQQTVEIKSQYEVVLQELMRDPAVVQRVLQIIQEQQIQI